MVSVRPQMKMKELTQENKLVLHVSICTTNRSLSMGFSVSLQGQVQDQVQKYLTEEIQVNTSFL